MRLMIRRGEMRIRQKILSLSLVYNTKGGAVAGKEICGRRSCTAATFGIATTFAGFDFRLLGSASCYLMRVAFGVTENHFFAASAVTNSR